MRFNPMIFASAAMIFALAAPAIGFDDAPRVLAYGSPTGGAVYIPKRTKLKRRLKTIKGRRK